MQQKKTCRIKIKPDNEVLIKMNVKEAVKSKLRFCLFCQCCCGPTARAFPFQNNWIQIAQKCFINEICGKKYLMCEWKVELESSILFLT